jgi:hypothetical protein
MNLIGTYQLEKSSKCARDRYVDRRRYLTLHRSSEETPAPWLCTLTEMVIQHCILGFYQILTSANTYLTHTCMSSSTPTDASSPFTSFSYPTGMPTPPPLELQLHNVVGLTLLEKLGQ